MDESQSLNYNSIENELDFDISQLDWQRFHADESDYSKILADETNNKNGTNSMLNSETEFSWLNDFTLIGTDSKRFGRIDDEIVIGASDGFPDKIDSENLANGLSVSHSNNWIDSPLDKLLENCTGFTGSQTADANNGQFIGDDFVFSKQLDLVREPSEISPKRRKTVETLTSNHEIDGFVKAFDEINPNIVKMREDRTVKSANFEIKKPQRSGRLVSNYERENMKYIQTDPRCKRMKISDTVNAGEISTTNLSSTVSSKGMTQYARSTGRGRNRNAGTGTHRSEAGFSTKFEKLNPVPSPEAEMPSLSPINTNAYIADDELITLDTKDLNRRVKHLPKAIVQDIKHRRRTLKNRGYARSCREKKIDETSTLQKSNADLEKDLACISLELQVVMLQRNEWKRKYEQLASDFKKRGIQVEQ